jgi:hypothetical protein
MVHRSPIPLVLLAGESKASTLPPGSEGLHPLQGFKAAELQINGRPLLVEVLRRLRATEAFGPIFVAGPHRIYQSLELGDAEIVDCDGHLGQNLRVVTEYVMQKVPGQPVAFAMADILPEPVDLMRAVDDFWKGWPSDFFMLECRVDPQSLGSAGWKPKYWIRGEGDSQPVPCLPAHLVFADPAALRRQVLYRILDIVYRTRNASIGKRMLYMGRDLTIAMLQADWRELRAGRLPTVLFDINFYGVLFAFQLMRGIDHVRLASLLRKVCVERSHRRLFPERRGRVAVLDVLSLARDIDTAEEARDLAAQIKAQPLA